MRVSILTTLAGGHYPMCPTTPPAPATPPQPTPAEWWRVEGRDLLPVPKPHIAPGWMLAGKRGYLEARTDLTAHFEHPTPAGALVIEATSTLFVDWGDGSALSGPYADAGGPWPNGRISHAWSVARTYDVRVVQRWTATWRLGAESGQLEGLETVGVIDDFLVDQLQAVRNI